ncbi:MAG: hypothetical protein MI748_17655 [Opitutales bacterium]|nr:hypothetical protein [Opitutales bacterium]
MEITTSSSFIESSIRPTVGTDAAISVAEEEKPVKEVLRATTEGNSTNVQETLPLSSTVDVRQVTLQQGTRETPDAEATEKQGNSEELPTLGERATDDLAPGELTEEEKAQVEKLKARDAEVRQHEQAHLAAAGSYALGGIQYEYQTGPDGKQYAIGGHVNLDTSKESTPEATLDKARQIQRAALAPADPSPQDIKVAAQASQMALEAQREIVAENSQQFGSEEGNEAVPADQVSFSPGLGASVLEDVESLLTGKRS